MIYHMIWVPHGSTRSPGHFVPEDVQVKSIIEWMTILRTLEMTLVCGCMFFYMYCQLANTS